mgnify:CR=1 FL=1
MGFESMAVRGVNNHFGPRKTNAKFGGDLTGDGLIKKAVWQFMYNDLPDASTSKMEQVIPANAKVISAYLEIITAFTSTSTTTDLTVGLQDSAGSAIDDDGLLTAANASQTTIAVAGALIVGTGALVGATIGTTAGELAVIASAADLLTGEARVIVEYMLPAP